MRLKNILTDGTIAGLAMGIFLFLGGAVFSRIIYGPQFAPPGKFTPEQLNAIYFIWTKLLIGWIFGILFAFAYWLLPLRMRFTGAIHGLKYGLSFWCLTTLWNLSHPLVYGSINVRDQVFWVVYQLVGFAGLGAVLGVLNKRRGRHELSTATPV
ncbi:MAG TPA: hypothetical protein VMG09_09460 [Bacteroidota bacterium]|nr:hypothetical protein [Bacteroidota bacterium]